MSTISLFRSIDNKHHVYKRKNCVKMIFLKNGIINKRAVGIIRNCKNLLYL